MGIAEPPAHYTRVECPKPLAHGIFTWLYGREFLWKPNTGKTHASFWFKDHQDAVLFKLMWS